MAGIDSVMHTTPNEESYKQPYQEKPNLKGDRLNICLLTFLYVLQGIPVNFAAAVRVVLQNRGAGYTDQVVTSLLVCFSYGSQYIRKPNDASILLAEFSIATFAYAFKLLWSPMVDCVYSKRLGRRKSWLVPAQLLIGIFMLLMSLSMDDWLGSEDGTRKPRIHLMTLTFFCCVFLSATQDIAVDGWSLTMLQRRNVGHSGTCNSIGYAASQFFGYILFLILDSKDFWNKFRSTPKPYGLISFADYMLLWAIIFIITTILVLIFKKENSRTIVENQSEIKLSLQESYQLLWQVSKMKPILLLCLLLLTCRIGLTPAHIVAPLKLLDFGLHSETLAFLCIPLLPVKMLLPFILSKDMTGPQCMRCFGVTVTYKIAIGILLAVFVYWTPFLKQNGEFPMWYYGLLLLIYGLENVSDPRFGGMYLTLMNTVYNLGGSWSQSVFLSLVDVLTWRKCRTTCVKNVMERSIPSKSCLIIVDGFCVEVILSSIITVLWLQWGMKRFIALQNLEPSRWLVERNLDTTKDEPFMLNGEPEERVSAQIKDH